MKKGLATNPPAPRQTCICGNHTIWNRPLLTNYHAHTIIPGQKSKPPVYVPFNISTHSYSCRIGDVVPDCHKQPIHKNSGRSDALGNKTKFTKQ